MFYLFLTIVYAIAYKQTTNAHIPDAHSLFPIQNPRAAFFGLHSVPMKEIFEYSPRYFQ
jgi:hypothetical protein